MEDKKMKSNQRRNFIKQSGLIGLASLVNLPAMAFSGQDNNRKMPYVNFTRDGLDFSTQIKGIHATKVWHGDDKIVLFDSQGLQGFLAG